MSIKVFNEVELKSKISQGHLKTVCLWTEKEFIELLKYNENSIYKISSIYSLCDLFNITIKKLLLQINENDFKYSKFSYLFNSNAIAKRAAAMLIVKKFIKNNDLEYITDFLNKENIDMEIIINILLINDERIENFQLYLNQKYIIEQWNKNETKNTKIFLSLSPWLISELAKKYKIIFTLLFSSLLKELFLIFTKLTTFTEIRLRTTDHSPIFNTNIYIENLDKKNKKKFEQILSLINHFHYIKEYQSIINFHLKDFINTLYQYENIQQSNQSLIVSNPNSIPIINTKNLQLISKFKSILIPNNE
ncbi:hypothetical protein PIROE2DRAFT_3094 [Piromyces sp. E2]|nr:hypothetical protein PIROE2DRAFT_3094 [Piromyces sp. E2]|eukprot:OUM69034.1 hypothetical protein PIROE2DRAFT_3094 [Piromyces sp. E2]